MSRVLSLLVLLLLCSGVGAQVPAGLRPYSLDSFSNAYGAGSRYGVSSPYRYGVYSDESWENPYASRPPVIYSRSGVYHGELSRNRYRADSVSNPYGRYGSAYSPYQNGYGSGSSYLNRPLYVFPKK